MRVAFFATAAELRAWLKTHHANKRELLLGLHKKASGRSGVTYHEALDEALCFGWIDARVKRLNADSYTIRFTPRRKGSYWSRVNIARAKALVAAKRMTPAGLAAFKARDEAKTRKYSFERDTAAFGTGERRRFKAHKKAWAFFQAQPPGYRKLMAFMVMGGKKEATRAKRLKMLIARSAERRRVELL
jgi:uncharacterized protein YdeI (YjbR/CyaY-like superfamily)